MPLTYRQFNFVIALMIFSAMLVAYIGLLARWRGDDFYDASSLAKAVNSSGGVASTYAVPFFEFKKAIFDLRQPDIVVVGSSRGLLFRQSAFRRPFTNLGGGGHTPEYGFALLDKVFIHRPPRVILYAIDYWTFLPTSDPVEERPYRIDRPAQQVRSNSALLVYRLLADSRITLDQFKRLIGIEPIIPTPLPTYGMNSKSGFVGGYGPDGSSYSLRNMETASNETARERFYPQLVCLEKQKDCSEPMRPAEHFDIRRLAQLKRLLAEFASRRIYVVPFLAPMPPMVMSAFRANGSYQYIPELREALKREIPEMYDMTDIDALGASDCEFLDGIHAGEIANLRVLLELGHMDAMVADYIDVKHIQSTIQNYQNAVIAVTDSPTEALSNFINSYREMSRNNCGAMQPN